MTSLVVKAYLQLIRFDFCLAHGDFSAMYTQSASRGSQRAIGHGRLVRFATPWTWPAFGIGNRCSACSAPRRQHACSRAMGSPRRW